MSCDFYKSPMWRKLRERALKEYGSACMNCSKTPKDTGRSPHVDHIYPRSKYPTMELVFGNLQVLCERCTLRRKGTHIVDYRTPEQSSKYRHLFENLKPTTRVIDPIKKRKRRKTELPTTELRRREQQRAQSVADNKSTKNILTDGLDTKQRRALKKQNNKKTKQLMKIQRSLLSEVNKIRTGGIALGTIEDVFKRYRTRLHPEQFDKIIKRCNLVHLI